ncbi:uncharacterized protein LOC136746751 isoform X1 [Amia ocellicauda]|uniref:uncharacterized protein LOC136746751 isoform X1 n=1 Tax=Amia ocellicauda TaxID=2972642 RepID=UPI0034643708
MSSMKRQSSWQEDMVKNFSRFFSRTRSQEPAKPADSHSVDDKENEINSPYSENKEEPLSKQLVIDLSEAFQGTEEKDNLAQDAVGLPLQEPTRDPPPSQPPCAEASREVDDPPPPLDAFLRKLGSLFHLPSKSDSQNPKGAEWQGARDTGDAAPDLRAMALEAGQGGPHRQPHVELLGETDCRCQEGLERERGREAGEQGEEREGRQQHQPQTNEEAAAPQDTALPSDEHRSTDSHTGQHLNSSEDRYVTTDGSSSGDQNGSQDSVEQCRLALSCPPAVTYGTYRGMRTMKKIEKHQSQVDSPIPEGGEEAQPSSSRDCLAAEGERGIPKPGPQNKLETIRAQETCDPGAVSTTQGTELHSHDQASTSLVGHDASCDQKAVQSSEKDLDVSRPPRSSGMGSVAPLSTALSSENSAARCALVSSEKPDLSIIGSLAMGSNPGLVSASLVSVEKDTLGKLLLAPNEAQSGAADYSAEKTAGAPPEIVNEETKGSAEQAEIQSPIEGLGRSLLEGSHVPLCRAEGAQGIEHIHRPSVCSEAVASPRYKKNLKPAGTQYCVSMSGSPETEHKDNLLAAEENARVSMSIETATQLHCGERESESAQILTDGAGLEEMESSQYALQSQSKEIVDNILRNALAALHKIEASEQECLPSEVRSPGLASGVTENADGHLHIHDNWTDKGFESNPSPETTQQSLIPDITQADRDRSALSSGYESFTGSDTDIGNIPGVVCDQSSRDTLTDISDQSQGTPSSPAGRPGQVYPSKSSCSHSVDSSGYHDSLTDLQVYNNVEPIGTDNIGSPRKGLIGSSGVLLQTQSPAIEYDDKTPRGNSTMANQTECVSVQSKKDNMQIDQAVIGDDCNGDLSMKATEIINEALRLAKAKVSSNQTCKDDESITSQQLVKENIDDINVPINVKKTVQLKQEQETTISSEVVENEPHGRQPQDMTQLTNPVHPSPVLIAKVNNIVEQVIPSNIQVLHNSEEHVIRNGALDNDLTKESASKSNSHGTFSKTTLHNITCQTGQKALSEPQEICDTRGADNQSFLLVQSYLAAVIEDESDSDGDDNCQNTQRGYMDTSSQGEKRKGLDSDEKLARRGKHPTLHSREGGRQSDCAEGTQHRKLPPEKRGDSVIPHNTAEAGSNDDMNKTTGNKLCGKKAPPDIFLSTARGQPLQLHLHRFNDQDSHESEGGFDSIDEEEEADTVFINDSGTMLSPTFRRGKAYPFSLSPIYEEESFREEVAMENLPDQSFMEEDSRTEEQQASSILSLLQSVSERLQLSSFSDPHQDFSEEPSAPLQDCLWGLSLERDSEDTQTISEEQSGLPTQPCETPEEMSSHGTAMDKVDLFSSSEPCASETLQVSLPQEEPGSPTTLSNPKPTTESPFYQYLMSARSLQPERHNLKVQPRRTLLQLERSAPPSVTEATETRATSRRLPDRNLKANPRPVKMIIFEGDVFSGKKHEIQTDIEDATVMLLPAGVSIRVVRGCWLLYAEPGYRGPCVLLEEGDTVMERSTTILSIGSIRRAVQDHSIPEIEFHPVGKKKGAPKCFQGEVEDFEKHGGGAELSSFTVKAGCWLAYDKPNFDGNYTVLEANSPRTPDASKPEVKSLRPLRMGGLKVQNPMDPRVVVYENASFGGRSRELGDHTPSLAALRGLQGVGSLRVTGGIWVAYSDEGYKGNQYLLEEGDYSNWQAWGGSEKSLLSLRYIQAELIEPSVSLIKGLHSANAEESDISDLDMPDLDSVGCAGGVDSIHVKNGVWVAYSQKFFCGKQYVLEKGVYKSLLDWGGSDNAIRSIRPIRLEPLGRDESQFLLRAYSEPHYHGSSEEFEAQVLDCSLSVPKSFRVIRGCWLLFNDKGFAGNQFVLEEGLYPDLTSCGCVATSIKSLKPIPYSFSDASVSLFSLDSFEGQEMVIQDPMETVNNFFTQSIRVNSGRWVVYEYANFKGRQMLLNPEEFGCWSDYSGWKTIGSLQPLGKPKMYIRLRNRALGTLLTSEAVMEESTPAMVFLSPAVGTHTQLWSVRQGLLRCKANKACLAVIGGKDAAGGRVALWPEHGRAHQRWRVNENGTISSHLNHHLVLDLRGGKGYDKDHLVVNEFTAEHPTQYWDIEIV